MYQERPAVQAGVLAWPTLTATNYIEWALLMQINLEACVLWEAVEGNPLNVPTDKAALAAIIRAVPPEMQGTLVVKKTSKEAWDAIKVMRIGVDRVRQASPQRLRRELEIIAFHGGETLDSFTMRITALVNNLRALGDDVPEVKVVEKILREVPRQYGQMACSIETLIDLNTLTVEELVGRLRSSEGRSEATTAATNAGNTLLLTEAEWEARRKERERGQGSGSGDGKPGKKGKPKHQQRGANGERDMTQVKCYNCNQKGHFSKSCPEPRKERKGQAGQAHLARQDDDEPAALLMARVCTLSIAGAGEAVTERVLLNEERSQARVAARDGDCDTHWFLDTGASNHMTGRRDAFTELDTGITGTVKLGDGSSVNICGRGTILLKCRTGEHRTLTDVYYLPRLQSNIISIGQLDEINYETRIRGGVLRMWDPDGKLLARVQRSPGRLYVLRLELT
jgi:hypothetical protein